MYATVRRDIYPRQPALPTSCENGVSEVLRSDLSQFLACEWISCAPAHQLLPSQELSAHALVHV